MDGVMIVDAVRSPTGARNGLLSGWHPADLLATVLSELARRSAIDPGQVGLVVVGCVTQVANQARNVGRSAVLGAGWPEAVPAVTVDQQEASSHLALHVAAQAVASGSCSMAVAAGVEVVSTTPPGSSAAPGPTSFGVGMAERYRDQGGLVPPIQWAERLAAASGLDRDSLDAEVAASHHRAAAAQTAGELAAEVVPLAARRWDVERRAAVELGRTVFADEPVRTDLGPQVLADYPALAEPAGVVSAMGVAPSADGAAAILVASEEAAAAVGAVPRARLLGSAVLGSSPTDPGDALAAVTTAGLASAGRRARGAGASALAWIEIDEPFAVVPAAWRRRHREVDPSVVNSRGGALALGLAPGAAGARLLTTLVHRVGSTDPTGADGWGLGLSVAAGGLTVVSVVARP